MTPPLCRIVASRSPTATVLLDLNGGDPFTITADGFTLGAPAWSGGPGQVGGLYDYRTVGLTLAADQQAGVEYGFRTLARLLSRRSAWLHWQQSPTSPPCWLRLWQSTLGEISYEEVYDTDDGAYALTLSLTADPQVYGARETLTAVTVTNNPQTGGCRMLLPAIKGDLPTPLIVDLDPSVGWSRRTPLVASVSSDPASGSAGPVVWASTAFTPGPFLSQVTPYPPLSSVGATTTSNAPLPQQVFFSGLAPSAPPPGRYQIWLHMQRNNVTSTQFIVSFQSAPGLAFTAPVSVSLLDATGTTAERVWVLLGEAAFPAGAPYLADPTETVEAPTISVKITTLGGATTTTVRAGDMMLIPIDSGLSSQTRALRPSYPAGAPSATRTGRLDGDQERLSLRAGTVRQATAAATPRGQFPVAVPGLDNRLVLLHSTWAAVPYDASGVSLADDIADTCNVTVSYYPAYHWMPSAGTA